MNIAQSWTVIGILGAFGLVMVGLMSQFLVAKVDQILSRVTVSEERLGTRMDRLETRMDGLDGRMDGLDGKFDRLDRDVQAIADRVFRDDA
jgi:outer membrane murein-binding lipoprotein Lpp